jgi:hypothetical protein
MALPIGVMLGEAVEQDLYFRQVIPRRAGKDMNP